MITQKALMRATIGYLESLHEDDYFCEACGNVERRLSTCSECGDEHMRPVDDILSCWREAGQELWE